MGFHQDRWVTYFKVTCVLSFSAAHLPSLKCGFVWKRRRRVVKGSFVSYKTQTTGKTALWPSNTWAGEHISLHKVLKEREVSNFIWAVSKIGEWHHQKALGFTWPKSGITSYGSPYVCKTALSCYVQIKDVLPAKWVVIYILSILLVANALSRKILPKILLE